MRMDIKTDRPQRRDLAHRHRRQACASPVERRTVQHAAALVAGRRAHRLHRNRQRRIDQLFMYWVDSNVTAAISHFTESPTSLAWSPDGRWLAFTMPVPAERKPLKVDLPEAPKGAKWADPPKLIDRMVFRVDGEGYVPESFSQLFVVAADGGAARQLTHGDFDHGGPRRGAPTATSVLIAANRRADADYEPHRHRNLPRRPGGRLACTRSPTGAGRITDPAVSPDGKHIAYLGFDDRRLGYQATQLYVMDADGTHFALVDRDARPRRRRAAMERRRQADVFPVRRSRNDQARRHRPRAARCATLADDRGRRRHHAPLHRADHFPSQAARRERPLRLHAGRAPGAARARQRDLRPRHRDADGIQ